MDSFDNKVNKMQREINEIKHNIDTMRTKNHHAMNSIVNSINSLSKQNSTRTLSTNSNRVFSQENNFPKENKKIKLTKTHSGYNIRNCLLKNDMENKIQKEFSRPCKCDIKTDLNNINFTSRNTTNVYTSKNISKPQQKINIQTSVSPKTYAFPPKNGRNDNYFFPQTTTNGSINTNMYTKRKVNAFNTACTFQKDSIDYKKIVNDVLNVLNSNKEEMFFTRDVKAEDLMTEVNNYVNIQKENTKFINKLTLLYKQRNKVKSNEDVPLDTIYNWVVDEKSEQSDTDRLFEKYNTNSNKYKEFCDSIIREHNLYSFDDMKNYVCEALEKRNKNEKFVIGMKKILCEEYAKKAFTTGNKSSGLPSSNSKSNTNTKKKH